MPVQESHRLTSFQDEGAELFGQARRFQRGLAVVVADVEQPALRARRRGGLRLTDGLSRQLTALLDFYESIGRLLDALAVPEKARFDAAGTLVNYVLGVAVRNAANARHLTGHDTDREAFLNTVAARWAHLDSGTYPFVHVTVTQRREHDDREQFRAGVDIFLTGIAALR